MREKTGEKVREKKRQRKRGGEKEAEEKRQRFFYKALNKIAETQPELK